MEQIQSQRSAKWHKCYSYRYIDFEIACINQLKAKCKIAAYAKIKREHILLMSFKITHMRTETFLYRR